MKKISLLLTAIMILQMTVYAFSDLNEYHYTDVILKWAESGVINGYEDGTFKPDNLITRAEIITIINRTMNYSAVADVSFSDISGGEWFAEDVSKAVAAGYIKGDPGGTMRPQANIIRGEVSIILDRIFGKSTEYSMGDAYNLYAKRGEVIQLLDTVASPPMPESVPVFNQADEQPPVDPTDLIPPAAEIVEFDEEISDTANTPSVPITDNTANLITGAAIATLAQAKAWAIDRNAHQRFIDIADTYWKYGEQTGIRPDVLYAQAAKETAFGRYTGAVYPAMNNWAGIKVYEPAGDDTYDHEIFETPDDGVRAHFNHIAAYIGATPIGKTHDRYSVVMKTAWAGTIKTIGELGGRWAPASSYGESIVNDYLSPMMTNSETPKKKLVYISPSNQFANKYTGIATSEGEQMYILAPLLVRELSDYDITVVVAERTDGVSAADYLKARVEEANNLNADAYICLHTNAANEAVTGTEIFYNQSRANSISLSKLIYEHLNAVTPSNGRGTKRGAPTSMGNTLIEVAQPNAAVALIEIDFHDVAETADWIVNNHELTAQAIAKGILEFFNY